MGHLSLGDGANNYTGHPAGAVFPVLSRENRLRSTYCGQLLLMGAPVHGRRRTVRFRQMRGPVSALGGQKFLHKNTRRKGPFLVLFYKKFEKIFFMRKKIRKTIDKIRKY